MQNGKQQLAMAQQNLKIGWAGFHQEGVSALLALKKAGIRLEAILTLNDDSLQKRSANVRYSEVLDGWDVPLHPIANINEASTIELLKQLDLDILFVIGWSQILNAAALRTARIGVIGAHASLLPFNRGSAPINWALIKGQTSTGNTLMWLSEEVDAGRIIDQMEFAITPYDTCATLYEKVAVTNRIMIQKAIPRLLTGEIPGYAPGHSDEPLLPRRRPSDGLIDWTRAAGEVYNFVRALTRPYPGAFSVLNGTCWVIQSCALLPDETLSLTPGRVTGPLVSPVAEACGMVVSCGRGSVVLLELQRRDGLILKGSRLSDLAMDMKESGKVWSNE